MFKAKAVPETQSSDTSGISPFYRNSLSRFTWVLVGVAPSLGSVTYLPKNVNREGESDFGAATRTGLELDGAAMQGDDTVRQREP